MPSKNKPILKCSGYVLHNCVKFMQLNFQDNRTQIRSVMALQRQISQVKISIFCPGFQGDTFSVLNCADNNKTDQKPPIISSLANSLEIILPYWAQTLTQNYGRGNHISKIILNTLVLKNEALFTDFNRGHVQIVIT